MTWEELIDIYLRSCRTKEDAYAERFIHMNYALGQVAQKVRLPELLGHNLDLVTVEEQDWITLPRQVYSVEHSSYIPTGTKLKKEPAGMRGRRRFYEPGEERPPLGDPHHWQDSDGRLWLRDTPRETGKRISISYRKRPDEITEADLDDEPIVRPEWQMALPLFAASNFYRIHPDENKETLTPDYTRSRELASQGDGELGLKLEPQNEESRDRNEYVRQRGYSFNISGR